MNIHRNIWEKIEHIKARKSVKSDEIVKTTTKLDGYAQTITLIEGRIEQMATYIDTRASIAKNDPDLKKFLEMSGYKYETLKNTLDYIKSLWGMTKNHLSSIQRVYNDLHGRATGKAVKNLTLITTINVCASLVGSVFKRPDFSWFGLGYLCFVLVLGLTTIKVFRKWADKTTYKLSDTDFGNEITK